MGILRMVKGGCNYFRGRGVVGSFVEFILL